MPGTIPSQAALAVTAKYEEIVGKHNDAFEQVDELHTLAVEEIVPAVLQELDVQDDVTPAVRAFLDDRGAQD